MAVEIGTIQFGGKTFTIHEFVGTVVEADRQMSTTVSGSGNHTGTSVSSTTHTHDRIFLVNDSGQEKAFEFKNISINARAGHRVQVIWMVKKGKDSGPYVSVKNLNTGDQRWIEDNLPDEVAPLIPKSLFAIAFIAFCLLIIPMTFGLSLLLLFWGSRKNGQKQMEQFREKMSPFVKTS